jgi:Fe-S cluster biosynthesis and repair protein YggX
MIIGFIGRMGCITGDTKINLNRCKKGFNISIKNLYERFNKISKRYSWNKEATFVRSFNGERIILHEIEDVVYSGKKEVFELKLENHSIKATSNHKIMTKNGMIPLKKLKLSDEIMCDQLKAKKSFVQDKKIYDNVCKLRYHNHTQKPKHILIYESHLNNIPYNEYVKVLRTKNNNFTFIDTTKYCVHHIDRNHKNNKLENLQLLTNTEHRKIHSLENKFNFNQGIPYYEKILSITRIGVEDTYDIICKEPYHNFVANGIVVHNSGKSLSMTRYVVKYYRAGYKIYSNIKFNFPYTEYTLNELVDFANNDISLKKSIIIIDEAHIFLDSRNSQSKKNRIISYFLLQTRKKGCHLFWTSQRFHQIDKRLRDNSDVLIQCKTKKSRDGTQYTLNNINILLENSIKTVNDVFVSSNYFDAYDSYEVVKWI